MLQKAFAFARQPCQTWKSKPSMENESPMEK